MTIDRSGNPPGHAHRIEDPPCLKPEAVSPRDSGPGSAAPAPFDYDDVVLPDAEELAAEGMLEAYQQLHPQVRRYAASEVDLAEEVDADEATYMVFAAGKRYDIYGKGVGEDAWILATIAFFDIVNAGLAHASHRFYARARLQSAALTDPSPCTDLLTGRGLP
jgi:hypothetical protein